MNSTSLWRTGWSNAVTLSQRSAAALLEVAATASDLGIIICMEIINRFEEKRPICLMAHISLSRLLESEAIDQVFHDHVGRQYERKIPFSALTSLMSDVTLCLSPSINAGYKKYREELAAPLYRYAAGQIRRLHSAYQF